MPPTTASQKPAPANGKATNGAAAAAKAPAAGAGSGAEEHVGKPDQAKYNAEQDVINKEIAAVKAKLDAVRSRISLSQAPAGNDRRSQLKAEMDALRGEQGKFKTDRTKLFEELRKLQDGVSKKIKDQQALRGKSGFKDAKEIEDHIKQLEKSVESGVMKLVDEKRALQEISQLKRSKKALESSASSDDAIAADKARIADVKAKLDDPEAIAANNKFTALKKEMDELRAEGDKAYQERNKLFDERTAHSTKMDELYAAKRELAQTFHDEKDKYHTKIQAIRQARNDRYKAEKAKEDASRRDEEIDRLREEARMPAYTAEIEDSRILINYFAGKYGVGEVPETSAGGASTSIAPVIEGVKKLEVRQVDDTEFKGMQLKKKNEDLGFFGGSGKSKKKGGNKKAPAAAAATNGEDAEAAPAAASGAVNLPMNLLSALLSFGIQPPAGKDDVARTVSDLETKKAWFEANSESKTKAEVERVEKLVAKMQKKNAEARGTDGDDADEEEPKEEAAAKEEDAAAKPAAEEAAAPATAEEEKVEA